MKQKLFTFGKCLLTVAAMTTVYTAVGTAFAADSTNSEMKRQHMLDPNGTVQYPIFYYPGTEPLGGGYILWGRYQD